ncbi:hypothetical protein NOK12_06380 [Nocardioides sp. OK12]|nr:hypothetical protein NOK12_06380 [Nocardioides sp. OK12]
MTTQSWQDRPRTTQVSQSILVVMGVTLAGPTDNDADDIACAACRAPGYAIRAPCLPCA